MQGGLHASSSSTPLSFSPTTSELLTPSFRLRLRLRPGTWNPGLCCNLLDCLSPSGGRPSFQFSLLHPVHPPLRPPLRAFVTRPLSPTLFSQPCFVASLFVLAVELWPPLTLLVLPLPRRPFQPRPRRSRRHLVRSTIFEPSAASFSPLRSFSPSTASCCRCCCCCQP